MRDDQQLTLSEWLQDGVFRGKFIDLNAIHGVDLVLVGESSSEWESLLDEWEQAESYLEREQYLHRAASLMERVPVPPAIGKRKMHFEGLAQEAGQKLEQLNRELNDSITKLYSGEQRGDVSLLGWGAASLRDLGERMASERPFWTDQQIAEVQPHVERARQTIIQLFPEWKQHQVPANGSPNAVGAFTHRMLKQVGVSLKKLGLGNLYDELETYTNQIARNAEVAAGASQLIRDVDSWLQSHRDASRVVRISENRVLRDVGKEYSTKLQSMSAKAKAAGINMTELGEMRTRLVSFLGVLKEANSAVDRRAAQLWETKLRSEEDLDHLLEEIESLASAYEGCGTDLEDFLLMRRVLRTYKDVYHQLGDERLPWPEFKAIAGRLKEQVGNGFAGEEIPWPPDETLDSFAAHISEHRVALSKAWIDALESDAVGVATMPTTDANRLHARASNPPSVLSEMHAERLNGILRDIETRLENLKISWLVERFIELPLPSQEEFLRLIARK